MNYKKGGLASAAQYLEAHGRGNDSMLVHMTPREVKGLQQIAMAHGGSLTINPHTGLPEAGFLDKLIPLAAGAALSFVPGMQPWAAGLLVGGIQAARTGDIKEGLMAGLGAYGGAGLTAGLAGAGAAATEGASAAATQTGSQAGTEAVKQSVISNPAYWGSEGAAGASPLSQGILSTGQTITPDMASAALTDSQLAAYQAGYAPAQAAAAPSYGTNVAQGLKGLGSEGGFGAVTKAMPMGSGMAALGSASAAAMDAGAMKPPGPAEPDEYDKRLARYKLSPNFQGYEPPTPNPYYQARYPTYAAEGGLMQDKLERMAPGGLANLQGQRDGYEPRLNQYGEESQMADGGEVKKKKKPQYTSQAGLSAIQASQGPWAAAAAELENMRYGAKMPTGVQEMPTNIKALGDYNYAKGGLSSLGGYSDGGRLLKGPGDGVSDDIPAQIGDKQPARLADGEFVIPARIVSELGNGSTDAGAKRLYAMMDNIQKARKKSVGKDKVAVDSKAYKHLPA